MKFLRREDFKYSVKLPIPHDGEAVRNWCGSQRISFMYNTANAPEHVDYKMVNEDDAVLFALRWA